MHSILCRDRAKIQTIIGQTHSYVHSNTIEGMNSHMREIYHHCGGWPADYMQFICDEFSFRSMHIPLCVFH